MKMKKKELTIDQISILMLAWEDGARRWVISSYRENSNWGSSTRWRVIDIGDHQPPADWDKPTGAEATISIWEFLSEEDAKLFKRQKIVEHMWGRLSQEAGHPADQPPKGH